MPRSSDHKHPGSGATTAPCGVGSAWQPWQAPRARSGFRSWLVIIVAGAAIPLTDAVLPGWDWISPTLGFIIVVAAGLERIFRRTTDAAVSLDELRRSLARERRGLLTGIGPYEASEAGYVLFIERAEALIAEYDAQMVAYARRVVGQDQSSSDTSS